MRIRSAQKTLTTQQQTKSIHSQPDANCQQIISKMTIHKINVHSKNQYFFTILHFRFHDTFPHQHRSPSANHYELANYDFPPNYTPNPSIHTDT